MQGTRAIRVRVALGCAVALASILGGAGASAAVPSEASKSRTVSPGATLVDVGARCPKGKFPVSGGFNIDAKDGSGAFPQAEGVDLSGKLWSLAFAVLDQTRVTTFAYCSPAARNVKFRSDREELEGPADSATVTATCRKGERAFSGGYAFVSSGGFALTQQSFRQGSRSWTVKAINFSEKQVTVLAFANCRPKNKVPSVKSVRKVVPYQDEGPTTATARCPEGRYALSGGYKDPASNLPSVFPESRRVGTRSWTVTETGISGRDDNLTVFAYCAKK